jgi:hypothetical protein
MLKLSGGLFHFDRVGSYPSNRDRDVLGHLNRQCESWPYMPNPIAPEVDPHSIPIPGHLETIN